MAQNQCCHVISKRIHSDSLNNMLGNVRSSSRLRKSVEKRVAVKEKKEMVVEKFGDIACVQSAWMRVHSIEKMEKSLFIRCACTQPLALDDYKIKNNTKL